MAKQRRRTPGAGSRRPTDTAARLALRARQVQAEAAQAEEGRDLVVDLLEAIAAHDDERMFDVLTSLLLLPPLGADERDAAGLAVSDVLCDELDRQCGELWSDLAGPLSLDPVVERFLPIVQRAETPHPEDLRWSLEYLGDLRLSRRAASLVTRELARLAVIDAPLSGASGTEERAERVMQLTLALGLLINADPTMRDPEGAA